MANKSVSSRGGEVMNKWSHNKYVSATVCGEKDAPAYRIRDNAKFF